MIVTSEGGFLAGVFFQWVFTAYAEASTELVFDPYAAQQLDLGDHLLAPFFGDLAIIVVLAGPALAMRLFSEEYRTRSFELLLTSPVTTGDIVLGKFLGALGFAALALAVTAVGPLSLFWFGDPDPGVLASGYLGLTLLFGAVLAMGMCASAWTENQIVALVTSFSAALALFILGMFGMDDPDAWLVQLAFTGHLDDLFVGRVGLSDVTYFVAFIGFFLFATAQRIESLRWR